MSYLDPATIEYCERCRCKTRHVPTASGERVCEQHTEDRQQRTDARLTERRRTT